MSKRQSSIALFLLFDAVILGLLYGYGSLNLLDKVLGDSIPNDMVWLLQIVQALSCGFALVKVIIDSPPSPYPKQRMAQRAAIFASPALLFGLTLLTIEFLLKGQEESASITFDLVGTGTSTLMWSATYLSIAIGLTLTYKVQRYGNFAQSELFMAGMFFGLILGWSEYYYPLYEAPGDGVIAWSVLLRTLVIAFVLTGILGVIIDRAVYRGFRLRNANPQVMMIASLGVALILRSIYFMRFSSKKFAFSPDADFRMTTNRWEFPTSRIRFNLGDRSLKEGQTYSQYTCEQTGVDQATGEPLMARVVTDSSRPAIETYSLDVDCITQITSNFSYSNGALPAVVFLSVALLVILLNRTRLGMRMRAVADNPELAASSGINVERVQQTSAFLSAAVTGVGGAIFAVTLLFNPVTAFTLLLPAFAVIVLGTIGSIRGAIVASILVGFVRASSTPILTGVGFPLDRSGYSAMGAVMPYIFLVAILIVLPKGLGDAWDRWDIERERTRSRKTTAESDYRKTAALAILPTGALGLHHWIRGRSDKAQNFSIVAIGSYVLHRILGFVSRNSFADGACSRECTESASVNTNLELITRNDNGTVTVQDSPYFADSPSILDQKWHGLMETEIQVVNVLSDVSDAIWPWVPVALWVFAIWQGFQILKRADDNYEQEANARESSYISMARNLYERLISLLGNAPQRLKQLNLAHAELVSRSTESIYRIISERISRVNKSAKESINATSMDRLEFLRDPYGREGRRGSWIAFVALLLVVLWFIWWLPTSSTPDTFRWNKAFQVSNVLTTMCIFILMSFALNLHTGYTGMVNFGVIFFVGVGAITVTILTAAPNYNGYGWGILSATIFAIVLSGALGWALAFPTARLRTDYFAIVTISLGEIVRILLSAEPLLRSGPVKSAIGIGSYPLPLKEWWFCGRGVKTGPEEEFLSPDYCKWASPELDSPSVFVGDLLSFGEPAPYSMLLALFSLVMVLLVWLLLERVISSPWGRIIKSIREDEEVAQHHGHDVLSHKAASLALGAGICGLAGAIWAWKLTGLSPTFMAPATSTFLVWAAFIIGGSANNKGMLIGASIIVLTGFVFNVLAVASSPDLPLYNTANRIDGLFVWLVTEQWQVTAVSLILILTGIATRRSGIAEAGAWGVLVFCFTALFMEGSRALAPAADYSGAVTITGGDMSYVRLMLVGALMLFSLKFNPKGLLPEVPSRPERPSGGDS